VASQPPSRPASGAARSGRDQRSAFDRFVEAIHVWVSGSLFFFVCAAIIVAWLASLPLWADLKAWQVVIHTVASVFTLLLLALIENASRRAEEAAPGEAQRDRRGARRADGVARRRRPDARRGR